MSEPKITVEYDAAIKRYRAVVTNKNGAVVYNAVRAKREAAMHAAQSYVIYQMS